MTERVTLILGEDRIEVSREDLTSKSEYFTSLLSPNFKDHLNSEHRINYGIGIKTLRAFVAWVSDHKAVADGDHYRIKPTLAKFVKDLAAFDDLLELLRLSVLFSVESLIKELTDLIIRHWPTPRKSVQIWLLAKELGLTMLRDLAKAVCIDRFHGIPEPSLLELSGEDFIELVGNIHVPVDHPFEKPVDRRFFFTLTQRWIKHNVSPGETNAFESRYPFSLQNMHFGPLDFKKTYREQQQKHNIQCIVGSKKTSSNEVANCVYGWDGTTFSEIVQLPDFSPGSKDGIVGMRVLGRGFDLYLVGGEYGENTGNFHKEIWRYSMISKTWYYVTSMPRPRRHMAVAFKEERLFLIGGSQQTNSDSSTVDVYNIYTGEWSKAAEARVKFTNTSVICENHKTITLYEYKNSVKTVGVYNPKENIWKCDRSSFTVYGNFGCNSFVQRDRLFDLQLVMIYDHALYVIGLCDSNTPPQLFLVTSSDRYKYQMDCLQECLTSFNNQVSNGPNVIGFSHQNDTVYVEVVKINSREAVTKIVYENKRSDILDFCSEDPIGCFNVFNPKSLNETFLPEL